MQRLFFSLSLVMLFSGLIACPGYWLYSAFSGETVTSKRVFDRSAQSIKIGDSKFNSGYTNAGKGKWGSSFTLNLAPEMNPMLLGATAKYLDPDNYAVSSEDRSFTTDISLFKNGVVVWTEELHIYDAEDHEESGGSSSGSGTTSNTKTVKRFDIQDAGSYEIRFTSNGANQGGLLVTNLTLFLKQNVVPPNWLVIAGGGLLILLALIGLGKTGKRSNTKKVGRLAGTAQAT